MSRARVAPFDHRLTNENDGKLWLVCAAFISFLVAVFLALCYRKSLKPGRRVSRVHVSATSTTARAHVLPAIDLINFHGDAIAPGLWYVQLAVILVISVNGWDWREMLVHAMELPAIVCGLDASFRGVVYLLHVLQQRCLRLPENARTAENAICARTARPAEDLESENNSPTKMPRKTAGFGEAESKTTGGPKMVSAAPLKHEISALERMRKEQEEKKQSEESVAAVPSMMWTENDDDEPTVLAKPTESDASRKATISETCSGPDTTSSSKVSPGSANEPTEMCDGFSTKTIGNDGKGNNDSAAKEQSVDTAKSEATPSLPAPQQEEPQGDENPRHGDSGSVHTLSPRLKTTVSNGLVGVTPPRRAESHPAEPNTVTPQKQPTEHEMAQEQLLSDLGCMQCSIESMFVVVSHVFEKSRDADTGCLNMKVLQHYLCDEKLQNWAFKTQLEVQEIVTWLTQATSAGSDSLHALKKGLLQHDFEACRLAGKGMIELELFLRYAAEYVGNVSTVGKPHPYEASWTRVNYMNKLVASWPLPPNTQLKTAAEQRYDDYVASLQSTTETSTAQAPDLTGSMVSNTEENDLGTESSIDGKQALATVEPADDTMQDAPSIDMPKDAEPSAPNPTAGAMSTLHGLPSYAPPETSKHDAPDGATHTVTSRDEPSLNTPNRTDTPMDVETSQPQVAGPQAGSGSSEGARSSDPSVVIRSPLPTFTFTPPVKSQIMTLSGLGRPSGSNAQVSPASPAPPNPYAAVINARASTSLLTPPAPFTPAPSLTLPTGTSLDDLELSRARGYVYAWMSDINTRFMASNMRQRVPNKTKEEWLAVSQDPAISEMMTMMQHRLDAITKWAECSSPDLPGRALVKLPTTDLEAFGLGMAAIIELRRNFDGKDKTEKEAVKGMAVGKLNGSIRRLYKVMHCTDY